MDFTSRQRFPNEFYLFPFIRYLGCVSEHMKQLKPFGDIPEKLTGQIKRSFVATRTLEQALAAAADVAKNMANLHSGADCTAALTKMRQCGACRGFIEKPCSNYCVNVMRGCLSHYLELDIEWDNFVQSMDRIVERLLGPFNIVMVVEPINIKISEAIMNFQVSYSFDRCNDQFSANNNKKIKTISRNFSRKPEPIFHSKFSTAAANLN